MLKFTHTTTINASPERVWSILTNGSAYPAWDPNMIRLDGKIEPGGKITAHTRLATRAFPVTVSTFEPARRMVWSGGMPLGLFKGVRTFTLTPAGDGKTEFTLTEEFSGPLLGLMKRTLPDMNKPFADFAAGLKKTAESA